MNNAMTQGTLSLNLNGHERTIPSEGDRVIRKSTTYVVVSVTDEIDRVVMVCLNVATGREAVIFGHEVEAHLMRRRAA